MHARWIKVFLLSALLVSMLALPALAYEKVEVAVNSSRILMMDGVDRIAVANPEIADVIVISGSEVMVVGKAPGTTSMHVWAGRGRASYTIEVAANDVPIANEIKRILGIDDIKVTKAGKTIILEGKTKDEYQKQRAEKIAAAYGEKVANLLEISQPIQVKIEAKVIEISKRKSQSLGIKWGNDPANPGSFRFGQTPNKDWNITYPMTKTTTTYDGAGNPTGSTRTTEDRTGVIWNNGVARDRFGSYGQQWELLGGYWDINAQLDALVQTGAAKVLSQPNIMTVSGQNANILVGGQIPVPISSSNGTVTVEWKDYGIKLEIAPEVNSEGLINGKIKAEVSALDWSNAVALSAIIKIPAVTTRKAESVIALSSGQTMAIGGMYSRADSTSVSKMPLLGDLPVLGQFFTSKSFSKDETELIILITPTIINPDDYLPKDSQISAGLKTEINKANQPRGKKADEK